MIRRPPRSTLDRSSAASDVYKRQVSEQVAPLMSPLQELYKARVGGATIEQTAMAAKQLSANMPNNYSPTTFLIQAIAEGPLRSTDYVTTLSFVNAANYQKAQKLS